MDRERRLFFALWPDEGIRGQLAAIAKQYRPQGSRAVPRPNLHATLVFLGSTPEQQVPAIIQAAASVQPQTFTLLLQQLEVWRKPQVLCFCPQSTPQMLQQLHKDLVTALAHQDIKFDQRAYRPHVTLARKVRKKLPVSQIEKPFEWTLAGFSLIESVSTDNGVIYRAIESW